MNKKKLFQILIAIAAISLLALVAGQVALGKIVQSYYQEAKQVESFESIQSTFGRTPPILFTETISYPFLVREPVKTRFVFWSKALTGSVHLSIMDANNHVVRDWQGRSLDIADELHLQPGAYTIKLVFSLYSGSLRFGLNEAQFVVTLNPERYSHIAANTFAGFSWDYLLYVPETVSSSHLLVVPNNTGYENNEMAFHEASAKNLIKELSGFADALGTPLLIPIFPRPAGELGEFYTHNLDRNVLLMTLDGYQRLDLQLIAMVEDARNKLGEKQIQTDARFLLWGFSASGTFSDRFSLLHPERLVAVAAGGCTHGLPFASYAGENLLYPVGTYDYESIVGTPFDAEAFSSLPRFLYKGDQDSGGTVSTAEGVYPADKYFDLFVRDELEANLSTAPIPLITGFEMNGQEEDLLKYRIYDGAVFVNEFIAVSRIYAEAGLDKSEFKLYPGAGHEITDEMKQDILAFFLANNR